MSVELFLMPHPVRNDTGLLQYPAPEMEMLYGNDAFLTRVGDCVANQGATAITIVESGQSHDELANKTFINSVMGDPPSIALARAWGLNRVPNIRQVSRRPQECLDRVYSDPKLNGVAESSPMIKPLDRLWLSRSSESSLYFTLEQGVPGAKEFEREIYMFNRDHVALQQSRAPLTSILGNYRKNLARILQNDHDRETVLAAQIAKLQLSYPHASIFVSMGTAHGGLVDHLTNLNVTSEVRRGEDAVADKLGIPIDQRANRILALNPASLRFGANLDDETVLKSLMLTELGTLIKTKRHADMTDNQFWKAELINRKTLLNYRAKLLEARLSPEEFSQRCESLGFKGAILEHFNSTVVTTGTTQRGQVYTSDL